MNYIKDIILKMIKIMNNQNNFRKEKLCYWYILEIVLKKYLNNFVNFKKI